MKRCYNKQQFKNTVYKIIHTIPDAAIGIDVMAGFPGESDRDFRDTYDLLSELAVAYLHVFPYSKRKGTEAAEFSGQLSEDVKKERASILRNLGRMKRAAFNGRFIGKNLSTLIESERDRKTGLMRGFSDNYINVLITEAAPGSLFANEIYEVIGIRVSDDKLYGKVAHGRET